MATQQPKKVAARRMTTRQRSQQCKGEAKPFTKIVRACVLFLNVRQGHQLHGWGIHRRQWIHQGFVDAFRLLNGGWL